MLSYNRGMDTDTEIPGTLDAPARDHLANVAANLQLVADMGYGDVALAGPGRRRRRFAWWPTRVR